MLVSNCLYSTWRPMMPPLALTSSMAIFIGLSAPGVANEPEKMPISAILMGGWFEAACELELDFFELLPHAAAKRPTATRAVARARLFMKVLLGLADWLLR